MALKEFEVLVPVTGEIAVTVTARSKEDAIRQVVDEEIDWREEGALVTDFEIDENFQTYATEIY
jgi:hypothetical protein